MSVPPDSDKVSGPGGILPRASAVGYWRWPSPRRRLTRASRSNLGIARRSSARCWAPTGSMGPRWTWNSGKEGSPTTTRMGGRNGHWSWPDRPACTTHEVRISARPAISCASRKAQPVLTGWSVAASRPCVRCACRRRVCRPPSAQASVDPRWMRATFQPVGGGAGRSQAKGPALRGWPACHPPQPVTPTVSAIAVTTTPTVVRVRHLGLRRPRRRRRATGDLLARRRDHEPAAAERRDASRAR